MHNIAPDEWYTQCYLYKYIYLYTLLSTRSASLMYIQFHRHHLRLGIYLNSTPNLATSSCLICSCRVLASSFVRVFSRLR
jgi:hypothetical protein